MFESTDPSVRIYNRAGGFGDTFPVDYAFRGASVIYQATFNGWTAPPTWKQATEALRLTVTSNFDVSHDEENESAGSIFYAFSTRGDFSSINDIKSWMDGAVQSAGFPLRASMVRFVSNPRRDASSQPPVGTPGADPRYTAVPPAATQVDTTQPGGILETAGGWWSDAVANFGSSLGLDSIAATIGISTGLLTGALAAVVLFAFLKKR